MYIVIRVVVHGIWSMEWRTEYRIRGFWPGLGWERIGGRIGFGYGYGYGLMISTPPILLAYGIHYTVYSTQNQDTHR